MAAHDYLSAGGVDMYIQTFRLFRHVSVYAQGHGETFWLCYNLPERLLLKKKKSRNLGAL